MNIETLAATLDRSATSVAKDIISLLKKGLVKPVDGVRVDEEIARLRSLYGIAA